MTAPFPSVPPAGPDCPDWPGSFAHDYRAAGYWAGETFGGVLRDRAARFGDRPALIEPNPINGERVVTHAGLDRMADALADGFRSLGVDRGDRVVVHLPNSIAFVATCFALMRLGALPVFALPAHRFNEIERFCGFARAKLYVTAGVVGGFDCRALARKVKEAVGTLETVVIDGDAMEFTPFASLLQTAPPASVWGEETGPRPDDVACFLLSGGSTGVPKLIPRRHDEYLYNIRRSTGMCGFGPDTVYLAALPAAHNFPMACPGFFGTLFAGGHVVLASDPSPDTCFPLIARHGVTATALVPPLAMLWLDALPGRADALTSLRLLQVGGAKLVPEVARRIEPAFGCRLQQVFGMAEGLICYTGIDDPDEVVVNTQGRPMSPADEIRVVDDADRDVASGEVGHLLTRGPYTIRGYYAVPEHNAAAFTADGFYRTGDLVRQRPDGCLVVEGRAKDLINRGGEKITAEEVEDLLLAHPAVFDVAVVGMPDAAYGERICAFVIPRGDRPRAGDLTRFLRARGLAGYKIPDRIEFIDAFPQTGVGKTSRRALRDALHALHFTAGAEA